MIGNYFRIAFRNIFKRRGYSVLNIFGLTIGMTCCLLIFHYVSFEKSFDNFGNNADRIARVRLDSYQKGELAFKSATSYPAIGPTLKKDFPEVENFCRLIDNNLLLSNEAQTKKFAEDKGYYADPSVISMFGIELLIGNEKTALDAPDKLIISESMAQKYFGNTNVAGQSLINRQGDHVQSYEITGVYKDFPENSHLILNYLVSYSTLGKELRTGGDSSNASETAWGWYDFYTYIQFKNPEDIRKVEGKMQAFADQYINSDEWHTKNNNKNELHLLPLTDIHLHSNYNQEAEVNGNGQAISFLFLIAIFIICIAWINYINLATARSVERAKEVGVRKVLGAIRSSLIRQFLAESFVLNFIAFVLSLGMFFITLRLFDRFTGREHYTGEAMQVKYWVIYIGMFVLGTLLSGLYPAFMLSNFRPVVVLKGAFKSSSTGLLLRKSLIVAQFITSVVLIAGTIIVYKQVNYMRSQQLGANIDQTLVVRGPQSITDSLYTNIFQPFKSEVLRLTGVKGLTASSSVMGNEIYWTNGSRRQGIDQASAVTLYNMGIDYDFIPNYDIKLLAGRNFSEGFPSDKKAAILNEEAIKLLGYKDAEDAIANNKIVRGGRDSLTIIGIAANFHHLGLQKKIDPMIILPRPNSSSFYSIKVEAGKTQQAVASMDKMWSKYFPNDPFNYFFLDESFAQQYKADLMFGKVFGVFAFLAILIACFGLLGLSAYNVLQRTKEIGIRKVLGASIQNILMLLSKDFMKLVLLALIIAIPIGWLLMDHWLQDYAYRINIGWWIFAVAGCTAFFIALLTISLQALKTTLANPVTSLRTE